MNRRTLPTITVASPCQASWERMEGDERWRFCPDCNKRVYNLSAMTQREAADLVWRMEGKMCARFYLRKDGTMLTQDCPVGVWEWRRRLLAGVTVAVSIVVLILLGMAAWLGGNVDTPPGNQRNFVTLIRDWLFPEPVMGDICPPNPPLKVAPGQEQ